MLEKTFVTKSIAGMCVMLNFSRFVATCMHTRFSSLMSLNDIVPNDVTLFLAFCQIKLISCHFKSSDKQVTAKASLDSSSCALHVKPTRCLCYEIGFLYCYILDYFLMIILNCAISTRRSALSKYFIPRLFEPVEASPLKCRH